MDEREKLRKFRELDDAFAQALLELEGTEPANAKSDKTPEEHRLEEEKHRLGEEARRREEERERQLVFERRVKALMQEYAQPADSVSTLMRTLMELGKIA